jgi:hypothetical protein
MNRFKHAPVISALVLLLAATFCQVGWAGEGAPEKTNCDALVAWDVIREVKLTQFDCALAEHGGQPALTFTVGLVNPTDKPLRYRINIFLEDMDKAAGHLVPRKGNPPRIAPGEAATVKIPFIGTDKESKKILVVVKAIST